MYTSFLRLIFGSKYDNDYYQETGRVGPPLPKDIEDERKRINADKGIQLKEVDDWLIGGLFLWIVLSTKPWK
tara:strand:- start:2016 stop:2231 length:216 start_codon:yes stop_codon:yes gene_type:complete